MLTSGPLAELPSSEQLGAILTGLNGNRTDGTGLAGAAGLLDEARAAGSVAVPVEQLDGALDGALRPSDMPPVGVLATALNTAAASLSY